MSGELDLSGRAERVTAGDLFAGRDEYVVPIYQRNYAWGEQQIRQLVEDLADAYLRRDATGGEYFLGNLVVSREARQGDGKATGYRYEVIDGQQRLTTLFILLARLRAVADESSLTWSLHAPAYQSRRRGSTALEGLRAPLIDEREDADAGVLEGARVVDQLIKSHELGNPEVLRDPKFMDYLTRNVVVVRAILPKGVDLNRYFETMNVRGQQLLVTDVVKARLLACLPVEQHVPFVRLWDCVQDLSRYLVMTLTAGDTGLRARLFGADWGRPVIESWQDLWELLAGDAAPTEDGRPMSGSMSLREAIQHNATKDRVPADQDDDSRFSSIITFPVFLLHVLRLAQDADDDEDEQQLDDRKLVQRFEDYLRTGEHPRKQAERFAWQLFRVRFLFDQFLVKREFRDGAPDDGAWSLKRIERHESGEQRPDRGRTQRSRYLNSFSLKGEEESDTELPTAGRQISANAECILLQSMLRVTYTSPRSMHWITGLLRMIRDRELQCVTSDVVNDYLRDYARDKVRRALGNDGEPPFGFEIQRIIFTYLDYLLVRDDQLSYSFSFRNSVEHFRPQHVDPERPDEFADLTDHELNCFGNLALVSVSTNSKFSNNSPRQKASFHSIVQQSPKLALMAKVAERQPWDRAAIASHHAEMVARLRRDLMAPSARQPSIR